MSGLVISLGSEGVVAIRNRHDAGGKRDISARETVRISGAIPSFMMGARDFNPQTDKRVSGIFAENQFQSVRSACCVGFHHGEFLRRQFAGLEKNRIGYGYLANIVQRTCLEDVSDVFGIDGCS